MSKFMTSESCWLLALVYLMRIYAHLLLHPLEGLRPLISRPRGRASHDRILSFAGNPARRQSPVQGDTTRCGGDVRARGGHHNRHGHHGKDLFGPGAVGGTPRRVAADKYCNPTPVVRYHAILTSRSSYLWRRLECGGGIVGAISLILPACVLRLITLGRRILARAAGSLRILISIVVVAHYDVDAVVTGLVTRAQKQC